MKKALYSGLLFFVLSLLIHTLVFKDKLDFKLILFAAGASVTFGYIFGILLSKGKKK
jgi:hypothetical protein